MSCLRGGEKKVILESLFSCGKSEIERDSARTERSIRRSSAVERVAVNH